MRCRYAPSSRQGKSRSADTVTPPGSTATPIASAETPGSATCTRTSSPASMTSTGSSQACGCSAPAARRNCLCRRSACSRSDSASVHIRLEKSRDLTGGKWRRRKRLSSAARNRPGSCIYRRLQPLLPRVAVRDEVHRLVVQEHVVREVGGLAQAGMVARELRAGDRDGGDVEQVIGAVAGIVAGAEVDLHAGDVVPQVEVSHQ